MTDLGVDGSQFLAAAMNAVMNSQDSERNALLDAARAEFIHHGFRRTSPNDIARRAKVSRATLYRKLGDKDAIVDSVVACEVMAFFNGIQDQVLPLRSAAERLTEAFVLGIRATRTHPLVRAIVDHDPDVFQIQLSAMNRPPLTLVRDMIAGVLADRTLPMDKARPIADLLIRITVTLLIAPSDVSPLDTDEQARAFSQAYLVHMIPSATA